MIGIDAQQRAREGLRKIDQALAAELKVESTLWNAAESFRDGIFGAFQFIENETMTFQELQVMVRRVGKDQLQIQSRERLPFQLVMDREFSYDSKPQNAEQPPEQASRPTELAVRLFAVLASPYQGLLRYYTIFADSSWKRTTFVPGANGPETRHALVPRLSADVLVLEAVDLLGYVCLLHPTWANLEAEAETLTVEDLKQRSLIKQHLSGLGAPRR